MLPFPLSLTKNISEDPCVIEAALILAKEGIAKPILVGNPDTIRSLAADNDLALPAGLMMPDPQRDADLTARIDRLYEIRKGAGVSREQAAAL